MLTRPPGSVKGKLGKINNWGRRSSMPRLHPEPEALLENVLQRVKEPSNATQTGEDHYVTGSVGQCLGSWIRLRTTN